MVNAIAFWLSRQARQKECRHERVRGLVNGLLHIVHLISCSTIAGREGKDRESEDNGEERIAWKGRELYQERCFPGSEGSKEGISFLLGWAGSYKIANYFQEKEEVRGRISRKAKLLSQLGSDLGGILLIVINQVGA